MLDKLMALITETCLGCGRSGRRMLQRMSCEQKAVFFDTALCPRCSE